MKKYLVYVAIALAVIAAFQIYGNYAEDEYKRRANEEYLGQTIEDPPVGFM